MTEQEAIEQFKERLSIEDYKQQIPKYYEAMELAVKSLEEIQQYREICTVDQCSKAMDIIKAMIERGIDPENVQEYIKFEDECVKNGYTISSLLESRKKVN